MWEIFREIHQNMMNWANSDKSDSSSLDYAIKLSDSVSRVTKSQEKSNTVKSFSKSLKKLRNSNKSNWEDNYMEAEDKLAEAMSKFKH